MLFFLYGWFQNYWSIVGRYSRKIGRAEAVFAVVVDLCALLVYNIFPARKHFLLAASAMDLHQRYTYFVTTRLHQRKSWSWNDGLPDNLGSRKRSQGQGRLLLKLILIGIIF
jgi:hypothetical protein